MNKKISHHDESRFELLYRSVSDHIRRAKLNISRVIDVEMVKAYWLTGQEIVLEEQQGQKRAGYGAALLRRLSLRLREEFGPGLGESTLTQMRKFYIEYQFVNEYPISDAMRPKLITPTFLPNLGWTHYRILMRKRRAADDNPTIGLILCTDKSNAMVRYTLGEKSQQIFASQYQLHLPSEKELAEELRKEVQEIEIQKELKVSGAVSDK